jgi:Na+/H+-dicarboxylate symporter
MGQVVAAVSNLDLSRLGKLGGQTILFFMLQSALGTAWGVFIAAAFKPGRGMSFESGGEDIATGGGESLTDVILGFFPSNIIESLAEGSMIHIVIFAIIFGIALSVLKSRQEGQPLSNWLADFNDTMIEVINIVMIPAPIGIFALVAEAVSTYGADVILPLVNFIVVLAFACLSYLFLWYVVTGIYLRVSPFLLIKKTLNLGIFAFAVSSSAVALPKQIKVSTESLGMSQNTAAFIMPLGMSLNSPGTALSNGLILVTAGQLYGMSHNLSDYLVIFFLGFLASYATAVIPGGGIVSLNMILPEMGFGANTIALFAAPDYFNGMVRTIPNVNLDVLAGLIVAKNLGELDHEILRSPEPVPSAP